MFDDIRSMLADLNKLVVLGTTIAADTAAIKSAATSLAADVKEIKLSAASIDASLKKLVAYLCPQVTGIEVKPGPTTTHPTG